MQREFAWFFLLFDLNARYNPALTPYGGLVLLQMGPISLRCWQLSCIPDGVLEVVRARSLIDRTVSATTAACGCLISRSALGG